MATDPEALLKTVLGLIPKKAYPDRKHARKARRELREAVDSLLVKGDSQLNEDWTFALGGKGYTLDIDDQDCIIIAEGLVAPRNRAPADEDPERRARRQQRRLSHNASESAIANMKIPTSKNTALPKGLRGSSFEGSLPFEEWKTKFMQALEEHGIPQVDPSDHSWAGFDLRLIYASFKIPAEGATAALERVTEVYGLKPGTFKYAVLAAGLLGFGPVASFSALRGS